MATGHNVKGLVAVTGAFLLSFAVSAAAAGKDDAPEIPKCDKRYGTHKLDGFHGRFWIGPLLAADSRHRSRSLLQNLSGQPGCRNRRAKAGTPRSI